MNCSFLLPKDYYSPPIMPPQLRKPPNDPQLQLDFQMTSFPVYYKPGDQGIIETRALDNGRYPIVPLLPRLQVEIPTALAAY